MNEYDTAEAEQMWATVRQPSPKDEETKFTAAKKLLGVIDPIIQAANFETKLTEDASGMVLEIKVSLRQSAWICANSDGTFNVGTNVYPPEHELAPVEFDYVAGMFVGEADPKTIPERQPATTVLTALVHQYLFRGQGP